MADWGEHESLMGGDMSTGMDELGDSPEMGSSTPQSDFDFPALVSIADTLPVMVAYCDRDQRYRFVNKPLAEWFERPRSEILGRKVAELMPADAYAARRPSIEAALAGEEQELSSDYDHPDRGRVYTKATYHPHRNQQGEVIGLVMVVENITEQRLSERALLDKLEAGTAALADRDARFRAVFDSLEMVALLDLDGHFLEINQRALDRMESSMDQLIGEHIKDVPFIESMPASQAKIFDLVRSAVEGEGGSVEVEVVQGGQHGYHLVSIRPIANHDGKPEFLVAEARDITELKTAQEQLRQAQKMEALGQLTGGIAHDFNNLLTVVVGGLDMITRRDLDDKTRAYATNALAAAERGARLTGQLLAFSRTQKLEVRPCDIAALIDEARPLLRNVLGPGIEKKFILNDDACPAMADPTQLEVALLNLAVNARDAMQSGGCLTFSVTPVDIDSSDPELEPGRYIELAVTDTGEGMPEDVRARVFEPFFTTKAIGKGTGLGLSMVYGMARQSGGTARIESKLGEGTRVAILLRCADQDALPLQGKGCTDKAGQPCQGRDVLVVDDDPAVRAFIVESLKDCGCKPREAADGAEALQRIAEKRPDLVILDYIMPGMSGAEVARTLLRDDADQAILFVSGFSETEAIRAAAPDAPILPKPFRAETLIDMIEGLVGAEA